MLSRSSRPFGGLLRCWRRAEPADLTLAAALAGAVCSDAFTRVALDNVQNHGGIGFTWSTPRTCT